MMRSKKIAITGGIGSGKSTLCDIIKKRGYSVFSCDELVAQLWKEDDFLQSLTQRFPACCRNGKIDRKLLAAYVFSDREALNALNEMSHPAIMERLMEKMSACTISFAEVPLLYEGGYEKLFDGVIALRRAERERITSVRMRDRIPEGEIRARMRAQIDASALTDRDCYILENSGTIEELERGAEEALRHFGI